MIAATIEEVFVDESGDVVEEVAQAVSPDAFAVLKGPALAAVAL